MPVPLPVPDPFPSPASGTTRSTSGTWNGLRHRRARVRRRDCPFATCSAACSRRPWR